MERFDILAKGGALPPGSIRNWGVKQYIKMTPGDWRRLRLNGQEYTKAVKKIVERVREEEESGAVKPQEPLERIFIVRVTRQEIDHARSTGIDLTDYLHEISNYFIRHVIKNHGQDKTETQRGNLPITDDDFNKIPDIIESPDFIIYGVKRNNEDRIISVKHADTGTTLFFEEVLRGKKVLRGVTMYKTKKTLDQNSVIANIKANGRNDLSNIKIASTGGGKTTSTANPD
jgi:hypothetical protein